MLIASALHNFRKVAWVGLGQSGVNLRAGGQVHFASQLGELCLNAGRVFFNWFSICHSFSLGRVRPLTRFVCGNSGRHRFAIGSIFHLGSLRVFSPRCILSSSTVAMAVVSRNWKNALEFQSVFPPLFSFFLWSRA